MRKAASDGSKGALPEMTHNEIVGWEHPAWIDRAHVILLRDRAEHPQVEVDLGVRADGDHRRTLISNNRGHSFPVTNSRLRGAS